MHSLLQIIAETCLIRSPTYSQYYLWVGFLSYPEFLHCMKYVNRARRVDLATHLARPPASHHCNCTTPTDVASPDTLFRAQEAVSLSLQVQPTSFYISTRPPLPASALLWLSNPVPPRDRIENSFVIWANMNGGKRRGLEKVWHSPNTKLFKKETKTKTKKPIIWVWASVVREGSGVFYSIAKPNASATSYSSLGWV